MTSLPGVPYDARTITDAEVAAWCAAGNLGFHNPAGGADAELRRPGLYLERTWAGFDEAAIVSTLRSFPTELTLPGGAGVPAGAVTFVTTTSTHRRRGLATAMVRGDLAASADRGEACSVLIAAEWPIYGRFGYGPATEHQTWTVDAPSARLRSRPPGTVEFVDNDTARARSPVLYEQHRHRCHGEISRLDRCWDIEFGIIHYPSWPEHKPSLHVLARDEHGVEIGLAAYRYEGKPGRLPAGEVEVQRLIASGPQGAALLWDHLISLDLVGAVLAPDRPGDDLLPWLLEDARLAAPSESVDFLWVRPLDPAALLGGRRYATAGTLVVEVRDPMGFAAGRFAVDGGPDGAACAPTDRSADLTLGAAVLGSLLLGGHSATLLADAGLIDEHTAGALARADAMLMTARKPWCTTWF